jgi:hypothetical protein
MKKLALAFILLSSLSISAGGVKMKKAIKKGNKEVNEAVAKMNKACGGKAVGTSKHAMAKDLTVKGRTPENVVGVAGSICAGYIGNLKNLCSDEDYKEAIMAYTSIVCIPNLEVKKEKGKSTYVTKGTTLTITHHPTTTGSSDAYSKLQNSL